MRYLRFLLTIMIFQQAFTQAQQFSSISGSVRDKITQYPMTGAYVCIQGTDPVIGTITDANGNFRLNGVPLGRIRIQISFVGYHDAVLNDIIISSGNENFLQVEMEEKVITSEEVVIRSKIRKDQPLHKMAMISARSFSTEETYKYAGSFGDPARMAANFAGVLAPSLQRNDIIIRGNSPMGLLWRLDGVDIPNPNHFGTMGTTAGPVTILNNNVLTNSDFFTGAFPADMEMPWPEPLICACVPEIFINGNSGDRLAGMGLNSVPKDILKRAPDRPTLWLIAIRCLTCWDRSACWITNHGIRI
jgi:hypothetical protein